jgi:hypothetical protein
MKTTLTTLLLALLALAPQPGRAASSTLLGGTFNSIGVGTRPLGMGGAFAAVADDANAAYDNPAGMAFFDKTDRFATFTHSSLFGLSSLSRDYVAYAQADTLGFGAFGLSWNRFSANLNPETWSEDEITYSGAKAIGHSDASNIALGWDLKYMRVDSGFSEDDVNNLSVGGGVASGYGIGLALMARLKTSLTLGVVLNDIYSSLNWNSGTLEVLSPNGRVGLAYRLTPQSVFSAEVRGQQTSSGFAASSWHLGGEDWLLDGKKLMFDTIRNIGIRAGYYQIMANNDAGQVTVGATAKADQWQLDYAYQMGLSNSGLGATNRIGLGVNF